MARALFAAALFTCVLSAQKPPQPPGQPPEPPEEDESLAPKVYALNPVQARKEIVAGDYYFKKPNYNAAAKRYLEATRWDPGSAEAFLKLGAAQLAEDPKEKDAVLKKMAKWPEATASKTKQ